MKLAAKTLHVTRSRDFSEDVFKIAASPKAFDILSSKIYTDVPRAIIRELSTNAYDAHVEAGNPNVPFKVHLPTPIEPWFEIRDYGTGLSPEDVKEIYTTYFASTRNESNDFTGCLGLGSKSPFAYTDQFTVISYFNGDEYTYSLFKNEAGAPSIALLLEQKTNKPNGIAIKVNVRLEDIHQFTDAANKVYQHFEVAPDINATLNSTKALFGMPNQYKLYAKDRYSYYARLTVVMGQVAYEAKNIDLDLRGCELILYMPLGSCGISASREELQYDDTTVRNVKAARDKAITDIKKQVEESLSHAKTELEKLQIKRRYKWLYKDTTQISLIADGKYSVQPCTVRGDTLQTGRVSHQHVHDEKYYFLENDISNTFSSQKFRRRVKHWLQTQSGHILRAYVAQIEDHKAFKRVFGQSIKVSTLPDPPRKPREKNGNGISYNYIRKLTSYNWRHVEEVETNNAAIVAINRYDILDPEGHVFSFDEIKSWAELACIEHLYAITESQYKRISKKLNLPNFFDLLKDYTLEQIKSMNKYQHALFHHKTAYGRVFLARDVRTKIKDLNDTCKDYVAYLTEFHQPVKQLHRLIQLFSIDIPRAPDYHKLFEDRYPMLKHVTEKDSGHLTQDIIDYIKLKDAQNV